MNCFSCGTLLISVLLGMYTLSVNVSLGWRWPTPIPDAPSRGNRLRPLLARAVPRPVETFFTGGYWYATRSLSLRQLSPDAWISSSPRQTPRGNDRGGWCFGRLTHEARGARVEAGFVARARRGRRPQADGAPLAPPCGRGWGWVEDLTSSHISSFSGLHFVGVQFFHSHSRSSAVFASRFFGAEEVFLKRRSIRLRDLPALINWARRRVFSA